jgi:hypothetical protein
MQRLVRYKSGVSKLLLEAADFGLEIVDGTENSVPRLWFSLLVVLLVLELACLVSLAFRWLVLLLTPARVVLLGRAHRCLVCDVAKRQPAALGQAGKRFRAV